MIVALAVPPPSHIVRKPKRKRFAGVQKIE